MGKTFKDDDLWQEDDYNRCSRCKEKESRCSCDWIDYLTDKEEYNKRYRY